MFDEQVSTFFWSCSVDVQCAVDNIRPTKSPQLHLSEMIRTMLVIQQNEQLNLTSSLTQSYREWDFMPGLTLVLVELFSCELTLHTQIRGD